MLSVRVSPLLCSDTVLCELFGDLCRHGGCITQDPCRKELWCANGCVGCVRCITLLSHQLAGRLKLRCGSYVGLVCPSLWCFSSGVVPGLGRHVDQHWGLTEQLSFCAKGWFGGQLVLCSGLGRSMFTLVTHSLCCVHACWKQCRVRIPVGLWAPAFAGRLQASSVGSAGENHLQGGRAGRLIWRFWESLIHMVFAFSVANMSTRCWCRLAGIASS